MKLMTLWTLLSKLVKLFTEITSKIGSPYKAGGASGNLPSPRVNIEYDDIVYDEDTRELTFYNIEPKITIETVQNTNSMEPFVDVGHITIRSNAPKYMDDLNIGDVIVWEINRGAIIHTIIETGTKDGRWYCRTAGENINNPDPEIIRREHIKDVVLFPVWSKKKGSYVATEGD